MPEHAMSASRRPEVRAAPRQKAFLLARFAQGLARAAVTSCRATAAAASGGGVRGGAGSSP